MNWNSFKDLATKIYQLLPEKEQIRHHATLEKLKYPLYSQETESVILFRNLIKSFASKELREKCYNLLFDNITHLEYLILNEIFDDEFIKKLVVEADDEQLKIKVVTLLSRTHNQALINNICWVWLETRNSALEKLIVGKRWLGHSNIRLKIFTALKTGQPETIDELRTFEAVPLIEAYQDKDQVISQMAEALLWQAEGPTLETLARLWVEKQIPLLLEILALKNYKSKKYLKVRVYLGLLLDDWAEIAASWSKEINYLVPAAEDTNPIIGERARIVLRKLNKKYPIQALCQMIIAQELPQAQAAAVEAGYLPSDNTQKALFYFVTEQWAKYEAIDFDHRMLRAAYQAAKPEGRRRLAGKVRKAGKVDYLSAIAGGDLQSRSTEVNLEEAEVLVQILDSNREWEKLWALVFDLPLHWSVEAVRKLAGSEWQPQKEDDRAVYEKLKSLVATELVTLEDEVNKVLPPALLRAKAQVSGRVNDVAFFPVRPVIAIGTGTGKVVLWDMQQARQVEVIEGFPKAIGRVAFTPQGELVCAERTTKKEPCTIYHWRDGSLFQLGQHGSNITVLEAISDTQVISSGSDERVSLWNPITGQHVQDYSQSAYSYNYSMTTIGRSFWARSVCLFPDRQKIALLSDYILLVSLPELSSFSSSIKLPNLAQCATIAPAGNALILGQSTARLLVFPLDANGRFEFSPNKGQVRENYNLAGDQTGTVQGLITLPGLGLVAMATADGIVEFIEWDKRQTVGQIHAPGERLTSLKLSPDGNFIAIGDRDASFSLWDLRVLELRRLFRLPLAQAKSVHMVALSQVQESGLALPTAMQATLCYLETALRHRFRYDVELVDVPYIQVGDFDIEF